MADQHTDRPDPSGDQVSDDRISDDRISDEQISEDVAALSDLMAAGVEVDGEVQVADTTWVIYGHTSYDGETIVGEYHDAFEATEVFKAVPRPDQAPGAEGPP
jgi:hypothetical protein